MEEKLEDKYKSQRKYNRVHKDDIIKKRKIRILEKVKQKMFEELDEELIFLYLNNQKIIDDVDDFYLKLDQNLFRGHKVEDKYKDAFYLILVYVYRKPVFYFEFKPNLPSKHTTSLKYKLKGEYFRIYDRKLQLITIHPINYYKRFSIKLELDVVKRDRGIVLIKKLHEPFKNMSPRTFVGVILYLISGKTQVKIAGLVGLSTNGLRKPLRVIEKYMENNNISIF